MRVYQFMSSAHALDNLYKRRLKASTVTDMNDPFELLAISLDDREARPAILKWRDEMSQVAKVLCFSTSWNNPVLWSHYAEKHYGIALGFDVPDQYAMPVSYESDRLEIDLSSFRSASDPARKEMVRRLLLTKFVAWSYEAEVRVLLRPQETYNEMGLSFVSFSEELVPREVILGPRCTVSKEEVYRAGEGLDPKLDVVQSRLAFNSYQVV